ncbi:hypothetical protein [Confluentibacter lentus]|uniref:hypothetical protein n=1 Tax=Confluentibacter lentus TaxID=1699412 RepID=UPI0012FE2652|nr:hypothetical protein [Confluentibacter lentus]
MKKFILLFVAVSLLSCDKDDVPLNDNLKLESYYALYMDYGPNIDPLYGYGGYYPLVQLEYSKNKLAQRKGDFLLSFNSLGYVFNSSFHEDIVDELSYSKNKIIIEKKSYNPSIDRLYNRLRTIDLSNDGHMIKKTILELGASGNFSDKDTVTIQYTYNQNKLLTKAYLTKKINSSTIGRRFYDNSLYYYNQKDNLDSIITIRQTYEDIDKKLIPIQKIVEVFSNYDNASNPTKNLFMFDETFKRSLSKNNYASYTNSVYTYSNDGVLSSTPSSLSSKNWTYAYDEEGNIRLGL